MLLINNLTKPGNIKRIELHPDTVRIILQDGTERVYHDNEPRFRDQTSYDYADSVADTRRD